MADDAFRGIGKDAAESVELIRFDGEDEPGEQALKHRTIHVGWALRRENEAYAIVAPDPRDLSEYLGRNDVVVVGRDQVRLVHRQDDERDPLGFGEPLDVACDRGHDEAQVGNEPAPAVNIDNPTGSDLLFPGEWVADVVDPFEA